jgi:nitrate reductase (cytochrome), electron transfer subunit
MIKKILNLMALFVFITGVFMACSSTTGPVKEGQAPVVKAIADDELSYRNIPLGEEDAAPAKQYSDKDPGESTKFQRAFENAPPMIPHNVDDFLPIKRDDNQCLDCHHPNEAIDAEAPATPASHFYNLRTNTKLDDLAGANFNCTQCHAPQSNAPQIIRNEFQPDYRNTESKTSSNLLDILNEGIDD